MTQWGRSHQTIRSIQYGTIILAGTSGTLTITAVVVANSAVFLIGETQCSGTSPANYQSYAALTSATVVTVAAGAGGSTSQAQFIVVEYYDNVLKSNRDFTTTIASGNLQATSTITAVVIAKTMLLHRGISTADTSTTRRDNAASGTLTDTTTITYTRGNNPATAMSAYATALEFK